MHKNEICLLAARAALMAWWVKASCQQKQQHIGGIDSHDRGGFLWVRCRFLWARFGFFWARFGFLWARFGFLRAQNGFSELQDSTAAAVMSRRPLLAARAQTASPGSQLGSGPFSGGKVCPVRIEVSLIFNCARLRLSSDSHISLLQTADTHEYFGDSYACPAKRNNRADLVFSIFLGLFSLSVMKTSTREAISCNVQVTLPWLCPAPAGECIIYIAAAPGDLQSRAGCGHSSGVSC